MNKTMQIVLIDTSYEDESKWVEITFEDGSYTYEILSKTPDSFSCELTPNKLLLNDVSPTLSKLIRDCRSSDSDMLFVEVDEMDEDTFFALQEEVSNLELGEYIEFGDDPLVTFYGGVITKFIFPNVII